VQGDSNDPHSAVFDIVRAGTTRTRRFDRAPQSCDELHAAVGLAIALAIDMAVLDDLTEMRASDEPPPGPRWLATFLVGFGQELLPGTALAAEVGLTLSPLPILRLRLDAAVQRVFGAEIPASAGQLDATFVGIGLSLCMGGRLLDRLSALLCAGPLGGEVFARGRGYAPSRSARKGLFGVRSGARLVVTAGLSWVLDVSLTALVRAPTYEVTRSADDPLLRRPSSAAVSLLFGPAVEF
jgi:hypothetical protein